MICGPHWHTIKCLPLLWNIEMSQCLHIMQRIRLLVVWMMAALIPQTFASDTTFAMEPRVSDGHINLEHWQPSRHPILNLNGTWRFSSGTKITPDNINRIEGTREIPDLWGIPQTSPERWIFSNTGHSGYALTIHHLPSRPLALHLNRICSSADIDIVDSRGEWRRLGSVGVPGNDETDTTPHVRPVVINLPTDLHGQSTLVINVTNFHLRDGGICDRIELGLPSALKTSEMQSIATTMMTLGILFGVALYSLGLSIQNPIESSSKWLIAVCITGAAFFVSSESMLEVLFPNPSSTSFELHFKLRYLGLLFFAPALHRLCLAALKRRNESKLERYQRMTLWLFGAFILFFSAADFTLFVPLLAALFAYNMFRSILEVYRAWQYREPGSLWLLVGIVALGFAMLLQPLSYTLHNETRLAIQAAVVVFVFLQSQFIGLRFNNALSESRFLSEHLQEEISRKTRDLRQQQKELMSVRGELQSASFIDKTTGIYSRAYFENQLNIEWSRCMREQRSLAIILFDMDGSKAVNRDYGRAAGDQWLYHFAHLLGENVRRQSDIAARYGGDEFVLLLPDCDLFEATTIAEQFLTQIHNESLTIGDQSIGFSVTAGVRATVPNEDSTATEELINRAVVALHYAKEHKRGQVHPYRPKKSSSDEE